MGALRLGWDTRGLPRGRTRGYEGEEVGLDKAVLGSGGTFAWSLKKRPTLVFIYNPHTRADISSLYRFESEGWFVASSRFCDLVRVDVSQVKDKGTLELYKKGGTLVLYCSERHRYQSLSGNKLRGGQVARNVAALIQHELGRPGWQAITKMADLTRKRVAIQTRKQIEERKLIDPKTGKTNAATMVRIRGLSQELKDLEQAEHGLLKRKPGYNPHPTHAKGKAKRGD
ncbi:MAG: hypothetical protein CMJ83_03910 [Planctomycetes bacterium]|nr:hypothetical protein [Planctomycetota bacterium]